MDGPSDAWAQRTVDDVLRRRPILAPTWSYEWAVLLSGVEALWRIRRDPRHLEHIRRNIDAFVDPPGAIRTYRPEEHNLDRIRPGTLLLFLHEQTGEERYLRAAGRLRDQLRHQPRTASGGFWHKAIYPHQMWLDGLYMAGPFYARCARLEGDREALDDVAHQVELAAQRTRDPQTGLFHHAWDESRAQRWADPATGRSRHAWGRAIGWFAMAIVDVLDWLPPDHARVPAIRAVLGGLAEAVIASQDPSGLWPQVLDQPGRAGNYLETSASCMLAYALAKGVRQGHLPPRFRDQAQRAYEGVFRTQVVLGPDGEVRVGGICAVAGLGGEPYRDGSFEYYVREPVVTNDDKGVGAFILAATEIEPHPTPVA